MMAAGVRVEKNSKVEQKLHGWQLWSGWGGCLAANGQKAEAAVEGEPRATDTAKPRSERGEGR